MVDLDDIRGHQHREPLSVPIPQAALALTNGAGTAQAGPKSFALLLLLPKLELGRVPSQDFLQSVARPGHKGIIDQDKSSVAHSGDGDEDGAGLEGGAEP